MTDLEKQKDRTDRYWICEKCFTEKKLTPFKSAYTVINGLCGWCDREDEAMLTPLRDLKNTFGKSGYCILEDE